MYDDDGEYLGVEETLGELRAEDIIDPDYDYYLEGVFIPLDTTASRTVEPITKGTAMQALILPTTPLTVKVTHQKGRKCLISHIFIQAGDIAVADATLGGKFTEKSARDELRKFPHRFTLHAGYEAAKMLRLF